MCPQWHRRSCYVCGGIPEEVGPISGTGLCFEHAEERRAANLAQLVTGEGPYFDHWARRVYMSARKRLLDELTTAT
jgi:hypothetical protein